MKVTNGRLSADGQNKHAVNNAQFILKIDIADHDHYNVVCKIKPMNSACGI